MTTLKATPEPLVDGNGQVRDWGLFDQPFRDLNLLDADFGWPRALRKFRLKEWQHIAVISDEIMLGFAVVGAHYLDNSFFYAVDRSDGRFIEAHAQALGGSAARLARTLWNDDCVFSKKGYDIRIQNVLDEGRHRVGIRLAADKSRPGVSVDMEFCEVLDEAQPLIVVLPVAPNRPLYTHKMVCPANGNIEIGTRDYKLDSSNALVLLDVQKTYYPYNTTWRWATFAGHAKSGKVLAMNLVYNMIQPDDDLNENVIWVDGKLSKLEGARFDFDVADCLKPWKITTTDGRVDLTFTPQGERKECINLGLVLSDYHAPYGTYAGVIVDDDGTSHQVEDLFGVAEFHKARF